EPGHQLDDRRGEHQVEVELEPGGVALGARLLGDTKPRRLVSKRPGADHAAESKRSPGRRQVSSSITPRTISSKPSPAATYIPALRPFLLSQDLKSWTATTVRSGARA